MIPVLCTHVKALSLPRLEDALLADDWSTGCLVWDYWRSHNVREFVADPWHWDTPPDPSKSRTVCGRRQVSMVMPVPPQPMCPPETRVTVNYDVGLAQDEHGKDVLHVKSSAVSHDVPYGDHFSVKEKIELLREGDGVLVTKSWAADFVKRTFLRSVIESSVKKSQKDTCDKLMDVLQSYADDDASPLDSFGSPLSRSPKDSDTNLMDSDGEEFMSVEGDDENSFEDIEDGNRVEAVPSLLEFLGGALSTFTMSRWRQNAVHRDSIELEVWELQRRTTMFHDDWRAPFLPHDGQKQSRWVDERYQKHPAVFMTVEKAAQENHPPVEGPAATVPEEKWQVVMDATTDKDGWQYATDFYKKPERWKAKATVGLCRKRMWRCTYVRLPKLVKQRTIVVQIWELQRRTTIFQTDWRAPFLPHDVMRHRFRWVDLDYSAHQWFDGEGSTLASAEQPPIAPPVGWEAEGWVVAHPGGPCDSRRWQYSSDLNRSNTRWGSQSTGLGCRRRLWSCVFTEGCRVEL